VLINFSPTFTGPFTEYKIVVVAITTRHDGNASTPLIQRTDVAAPSQPFITNLACQKDGTILLRWKRPIIYYNTIDFYIVSYKSSKWDFYRQFQINASADHIETEVCLIENESSVSELTEKFHCFSAANSQLDDE
jgi:hypothetical protein